MKTVYTIGYEGTDIHRFVETLQAVGVEAIADVRALPLSRKKGFSKNALKDQLNQAGIDYISVKELGDPKPGRDAAKAGNYKLFKKIYSAHVDQDESKSALEKLISIADSIKICLLCFERDPKTCHRQIVGERMAPFGYEMFHLYGDDPKRYIRHREKLQVVDSASV